MSPLGEEHRGLRFAFDGKPYDISWISWCSSQEAVDLSESNKVFTVQSGGHLRLVDYSIGTEFAHREASVLEGTRVWTYCSQTSSPSEKHGRQGGGVRWFEPEIGGAPDDQDLPAI